MPKDPLDDRLLQRAARPDGPASGCLDPEVLAAWTDGTLTAAQRGAAEAHAADCDRCLMLLAAIAQTAPPPVVAEPRPWGSWRWLVPLATAAVALTTWITVRDLPPPESPAASINRSAAPSRQAEPPQPPLEQKAEAQTDARAKEVAATPKTAIARDQQPRRRADSPISTRVLDEVAPLQREQTQRNEAAKKDESTSARTGVEARSPPVTAPPPQTAAQASAFRAFAPVLVPSPDPNVQWRLSGSLVERSLDAGKTWVRQTTGTTSALVAGSSPAPTVCWLVGPAGTVVVTVDGERWRQVSFPDPNADIRTVAATDAHRAAVTTSDKRTYVTADGGLTWRLQEKSPAPF